MPLFSRSLKPGTDEAQPAMNGDAETEASPRHTIGELLRDTRKSYGGEIERIAATLRIRAAYLAAIEESQYDKLPGPVYAQGFVRAYAVHLGLDGNEAVRRFKHEIEGFQVSGDLSFPVPLAARSIPGGTMLLAALILAICGYGLWYYVSTGDRAHPERVSAVPPDFGAASQPSPTTPPAAAPAAPSSAIAPATASPSGAPASDNAASSPPPVAAAPASAPAPATVAPSLTVAPSTTVASSSPGAAPSPPAPSAPTTEPTASAPAPQIAAAPSAAGAAAAPSTASPTAPGTTPPRVFGAPADVPARIVIHAIQDSWIQVRNGDQVVTERLLHAGDTVRVPDRRGLSLRTGNGAGLELEVDGTLGKPLSGRVRTIALDADHLTGGVVPPGQVISSPTVPSAAAPEQAAPNQ
ncbi:MAG TPA: RodZ domain-containing protein [Stellaceae bacterium]|jgi:cytoskeleton protein RodZ